MRPLIITSVLLLLGACAVSPRQLLDEESAAAKAAVPLGVSLDTAKQQMERLGYTCTMTIHDGPRDWVSTVDCSKRVKRGIPSCTIDVRALFPRTKTVREFQFSGPDVCD